MIGNILRIPNRKVASSFLLGEREPYYQSAAKIASQADAGKVKLIVSALSYAPVFYLLSRYEDDQIAREKLRQFKVLANTSDLTDTIIEKGLSSNFSDLEGVLQYHCALAQDCNRLITRNEKDFKNAEIPVMTPDEYMNSLNL